MDNETFVKTMNYLKVALVLLSTNKKDENFIFEVRDFIRETENDGKNEKNVR